MTTEQKARAYDEALQRARELNSGKDVDVEAGTTTCEYIFPELKESENEKIRKELIAHFRNTRCVTEEGAKKIAKWVAWLEEQGEKKASYTTMVETGDGGINALVTRELPTEGCDDEQKHVDEAEPKFHIGDKIRIFRKGAANEEPMTITKIDGKGYWSGDLFLCNFTDADRLKLVEQKPADEDEPKFRPGDIVQYITDSTDRRRIEEIDTLCNMYHTDSSPIMFEVEDEWKVVVNAEDVEQESVDKVDFEKKELKKIESKKLDPDKVIAWLNDQACQGWIEDVEVDKFIAKFKKDFKL